MKKSRIFTPEQQEFIAEHVEGLLVSELTELINEHFGLSVTMSQVECYKKNHKINAGFGKSWHKDRSYFTPEEKQFIRDNTFGNDDKELAKLMVDRFDKYFSPIQIHTFRKHNKLKSGFTGRIEPGYVRNGKKMSPEEIARFSRNSFKPGRESEMKKPVGTKVFTKEGYIKVKVADPSVWEYEHYLVWEKHHGPVPEGYCLTFKNGNKLDTRIENLAMISKAENRYINFNGIKERTDGTLMLARDVVAIEKAISNRRKKK